MCRIASSVAFLSTKRTDQRSFENQLTVRHRSSLMSTSSSLIAFQDTMNRQFLSAHTSSPCESREMMDLRWEDNDRDDDESSTSIGFQSMPLGWSFWRQCRCCSSRPTTSSQPPTKVAQPTLAGTTRSTVIIDSDMGSRHGSVVKMLTESHTAIS